MNPTAVQIRRQMCQPPERLRLDSCLKILGLWPIPAWSHGFKDHQRTFRAGRNSPPIWKLSDGQLYALLEKAHRAWKRLCFRFRVDFTGNHETGVWLNCLWLHTKRLFARRGIGCSSFFGATQ